MITAVVRNITHDEFETIRDGIFLDAGVLMGTISANYSPKTKIGHFSFISDVYLPDILKQGQYKAVLTYFRQD